MSTSASVISLQAFRNARHRAAEAEHSTLASPQERLRALIDEIPDMPAAPQPIDGTDAESPDAVEVLETMIDCYFTALRTQLESIKELRS